jgi:hypothetical protein
MRCILRKLSLATLALLISAVPVLAAEGAMDKMPEQGRQAGRDECLLVSLNCANQVDSIQQRIDRIKGEISRGTDVYTNDELRMLNRKLDEATKTLEDETIGG